MNNWIQWAKQHFIYSKNFQYTQWMYTKSLYLVHTHHLH